jgi:hypothetical protein
MFCPYFGGRVGVLSFQVSCFGTVETPWLQGNNLPKDTFCAVAALLPGGLWLLEIASYSEQSSKPRSIHPWRC